MTILVWAAIAWGKKWPLIRLNHNARYNLKEGKNGINRYNYINTIIEGRLAGYVSVLQREGRQEVRAVEDGVKIHDNKLADQAREELHITQITIRQTCPISTPLNHFGAF